MKKKNIVILFLTIFIFIITYFISLIIIINIFFIIGLIFFSITYSFWFYYFFYNSDESKIRIIKIFRSGWWIEILIIFLMLLSLMINPLITPIDSWQNIPFLLYVRSIIWLIGLLFLPGHNIFRFFKFYTKLSNSIKFVVSITFSLIFLGILTLVFHFYDFTYYYMPFFILIFLIFTSFLFWKTHKKKKKPCNINQVHQVGSNTSFIFNLMYIFRWRCSIIYELSNAWRCLDFSKFCDIDSFWSKGIF